MEDQQLVDAKIEAGGLSILLQRIWRLNFRNERPLTNFDSVIVALETKLKVFDGTKHVMRRFGHLYSLIDIIRDNWNDTRHILLYSVRVDCQHQRIDVHPLDDDDRLNNSIDLAIEVWLMVRLQVGTGNGRHAGEPTYKWNPTDNFDDGLRSCFNLPGPETYGVHLSAGTGHNDWQFTGAITKKDDPPEPGRDSTFSPLFTLADMEHLGSFNIQFTNNLLNHLYLEKFRNKLFRPTIFIFSHATILSRLRRRDLRQHSDLLDETLNTLGLLIPSDDPHSHKWYQRVVDNSRENNDPFTVDQNAGDLPPPSRRVCDYRYWRPRLLLIEEEFKNSSPRTATGWWRDRRDRKAHATLWAAIIAIAFAILALVAGIVSAVYGGISAREAKIANNDAMEEKASTDGLAGAGNPSGWGSAGTILPSATPIFTVVGCCCNTTQFQPAALTSDSPSSQYSSIEPGTATTTSELRTETVPASPETPLSVELELESSSILDSSSIVEEATTSDGASRSTVRSDTEAPTETNC